MFSAIQKTTSILFTHKDHDSELEGAIDSFYCSKCQTSHRIHFIGDFRITMIRTIHEHPTTKKIIRYRQARSNEIPSDES